MEIRELSSSKSSRQFETISIVSDVPSFETNLESFPQCLPLQVARLGYSYVN